MASASKDGCSLCLKNCPTRIIIDLDQVPRPKGQKCGDLIVFAPQKSNRPPKGIALELKSGKLGSASRVLAQLQGALDALSKILECCPATVEPRAVVLCNRRDVMGIKAVTGKKLKFGKDFLRARIEKCSTNISKL